MGIENVGKIIEAERRNDEENIQRVEAMCKELWKLNNPKVRAIFKKHGFSFPKIK